MIHRAFTLVPGVILLAAWLLYEEIGERASSIVFSDPCAIKDWRRHPHWSISVQVRGWVAFGRWKLRDVRMASNE